VAEQCTTEVAGMARPDRDAGEVGRVGRTEGGLRKAGEDDHGVPAAAAKTLDELELALRVEHR